MNNAVLEKAKNEDGVKIPVECIEMVKSFENPDMFAHFHEYIEMLYLTSGDMHVWLNDKLFEFHEGELIIINSNEPHRLSSLAPESRYIVIKFTPNLLCAAEQTANETRYILPFISEQSTRPRVFSKEFSESAKIYELLSDAIFEWNERKTGYELAIRADILKIIRCVVGYFSDLGINIKVTPTVGNIHQMITSVLEYINENFKTVNEKDVAKHFNISYSYFSRSFKQSMGMSFKEYVNYLKINDAQKQLLTTTKSITDISMELGFSSSSHFINVFKMSKGCSPKQYKKNIGKGK